MDKPITSGLKTIFLLHAVVGLIVGLGYLLIPLDVADWLSIPMGGEDAFMRLSGAAILGFTFSSVLGYLAHEWREVRIVVLAEVLWTLLAALLALWLVLSDTWPAMGWMQVAVMGFFFLAFGYFYWREETMPVPSQSGAR